jgi:hypothetical protein
MIHWRGAKGAAANAGPDLRRAALVLAGALIVLAGFAAWTAPPMLPRLYFMRQDSFVLAGLVALLLASDLFRPASSRVRLPNVVLTRRMVVAGAALAALILWAATYLLFDNYPLTRDEQMVAFDVAIFSHGLLAAPLAPEWRHYAEALTPAFLLPLPGNAAWVSSYMPGNAMLRMLFGMVADPALMNPVLAAAGAVATFDCARRLFPDKPGARTVAMLMYATSAQVLVTALTPYAMTAHLALNMIWLSLYLRGTRGSHAAAIGVGFVAIGLHQVVFHPLFALPFIDELRRRGQWRTALAYLGSYALFGLFWISYPHLVAMSAGLNPVAGTSAGIGGFFAERVLPLLTTREPATIPLMVANLIRFVTWENLALVPLLLLGLRAVRRDEGFARPLAYGIALTTLATAILLPYQGHGWGYRYLHGLIGNCALLAAYGWSDFSDRQQVRAFVRTATVATVLGSLPFLVWQAGAFVKPYARVNRMIDGVHANMVVIETQGAAFRIDEVRNRPDLANRPIRLAGSMLTTADIPVLCARGRIAFVDARQMQALGVGFGEASASPHFEALRAAAKKARCASS